VGRKNCPTAAHSIVTSSHRTSGAAHSRGLCVEVGSLSIMLSRAREVCETAHTSAWTAFPFTPCDATGVPVAQAFTVRMRQKLRPAGSARGMIDGECVPFQGSGRVEGEPQFLSLQIKVNGKKFSTMGCDLHTAVIGCNRPSLTAHNFEITCKGRSQGPGQFR
jgi:hypothetical protein